MTICRIVALMAILASASIAAPKNEESKCAVRAYIADPDPSGTNVRAAPRFDARILTRLPHAHVSGSESFAPEVDIIGFQNGWAKVSRVSFADYGDGHERALFQGSGWISGKLLSATLNSPSLREAPSDDAQKVAHLSGEGWSSDSVAVDALLDCIGGFARITGRTPGGRAVTGWADHICSNQVTTCP